MIEAQKGKLYLAYTLICVLAFLLILVSITFLKRFNERRILMFSLSFNLVALIIFADIPQVVNES